MAICDFHFATTTTGYNTSCIGKRGYLESQSIDRSVFFSGLTCSFFSSSLYFLNCFLLLVLHLYLLTRQNFVQLWKQIYYCVTIFLFFCSSSSPYLVSAIFCLLFHVEPNAKLVQCQIPCQIHVDPKLIFVVLLDITSCSLHCKICIASCSCHAVIFSF